MVKRYLLAAFLVLANFSFPEVFWERFSFLPGTFFGEKKIYRFERLAVRGVPLNAEVIRLPKSNAGILPTVETQGKVLFKDAVSMGVEIEGQIVLIKLVAPDVVFRVTMTPREFSRIFDE